MPDEPESPVIVDKPTEACTYLDNGDGTFTRVEPPTVVPETIPQE